MQRQKPLSIFWFATAATCKFFRQERSWPIVTWAARRQHFKDGIEELMVDQLCTSIYLKTTLMKKKVENPPRLIAQLFQKENVYCCDTVFNLPETCWQDCY